MKKDFQSRFAAFPKDESEEEANRFAKRLEEIMNEIGDNSFRDYETPKGVAFVFRLGTADKSCSACGVPHGNEGVDTRDMPPEIRKVLKELTAAGAQVAVLRAGETAEKAEERLLEEVAKSFRFAPPGVRETATREAFSRRTATMTAEQVRALQEHAEANLARARQEETPPEGFVEYLQLIVELCKSKQAFALS